MAEKRDPRAGGRSDFAPVAARSEATKLAHWPPPFRGNDTKLKTIRQAPVETPRRATNRGWRLTRSMFSEFDEE